jgi:hypothetical protein
MEVRTTIALTISLEFVTMCRLITRGEGVLRLGRILHGYLPIWGQQPAVV